MVLGKVRNQRGAGSIGCLFMAAIIAAGMYAGFQFGIPRLRHSSFEDRMTESLAGNLQRCRRRRSRSRSSRSPRTSTSR